MVMVYLCIQMIKFKGS